MYIQELHIRQYMCSWAACDTCTCTCVCAWCRTLMIGTLGLKREDSWCSTSASSCWCFCSFLIFIIRTMAAYKYTQHVYCTAATHCTHHNKSLQYYAIQWILQCTYVCAYAGIFKGGFERVNFYSWFVPSNDRSREAISAARNVPAKQLNGIVCTIACC